MQRLTPQQVKQSLNRQRFLESMGERFATYQASKVPTHQASLLPDEHRHLAGKEQAKKEAVAARRKIMPAFLRKRLTRWSSILKLKLLAWSLKKSSSSFWFLRRMKSRTQNLILFAKSIPKRTLAVWRISSSSLRRKKNISEVSPSVFGENISATNTSFPMKESPASTLQNTRSEIGKASACPVK